MKRILSTIVFLLCSNLLLAEQVGKFEYYGATGTYNDSTMIVPEDMVAMSEYVHVGTPSDIIVTGNPCSIVFVVDVSQSNTADKTDEMGVRFGVVQSVLDSIYDRNPNVQVGMVFLSSELYFNPADDPLFEKGTGYTGGYIPLLELGKKYEGEYATTSSGKVTSKESYNKKGIDVLKMYLQTKGGKWGGRIPKYEPSYEIEVGTWKKKPYGANVLTNITSAFDGAKEALSHSEHAKDKRFVIFFSDGYATEPSTNPVELERYKKGIDVPTTFTIYYEPIGSALQELEIMTNNIKNNGYSTSNSELTNIWDMAMNHDNLVQLIIDKIIKKIITSSTTFTTTDVDVNGLGPVTGWDSTGFYFDNLFPLKGPITPFAYDITYHVKKDSIDGADTITVKEFDTTIYYNHDVKISTGEAAEDSLKLTYWGRNLEFYSEGTKLTEVGRGHEKIEVRFAPYKIDTLYDYEDVEVLLSLTEGSDEETVKLTKSGDYFSFEINREIGAASKNDGTLQHENPDTIVALFKNKDLLLDTLEVRIPYFEGDYYKVTDAVYYDRDANGFVDELILTVDEDEVDKVIDELIDNLELADYRDLEITSSSINGKRITLEVTEGSGTIKTYLNSSDRVTISDTITITEELFILPFDVTVMDSLAPVLMEATLLDSIKEGAADYLEVSLSEEFNAISGEKPLSFYNVGESNAFEIELESLEENGTEVRFLLKESSSLLQDCDSVNIHSEATTVISDKQGVAQKNPENRKVPLKKSVISDFVKLDEATYFDTNGDGLVDKIDLDLSMDISSDAYDDVVDALKLCERRNFEIDSYTYTSGTLSLKVTEKSGLRATALQDDDTVVLSDTIALTGKYSLVPSSVLAIDSVAPVIEKASYAYWSGRDDSLTVVFSEDLQTSGNKIPFTLCDSEGNNSYSLTVGSGSITGNTVLYAVEGKTSASKGDSIRIALRSDITDAFDNEQKFEENRRVELRVSTVLEEKLLTAVYRDTSEISDGYIDCISLRLSRELPVAVSEKVMKEIKLPEDRFFTAKRELERDNEWVHLFVEQDRSEVSQPATSLLEGDTLSAVELLVPIGDTSYLVTSEMISIEDSLAPVIVRAEFHPMNSDKDEKIIDTLVLSYSEVVRELDRDVHFGFFDKSRDTEVSPKIKTGAGEEGATVRYFMDAYDHFLPDPSDRDSIWIYASRGVEDNQNIEQKRNSVRVPLLTGKYNFLFDVSLFPNPYSFQEEEYVNPVLEEYTDDDDRDAVAILVQPKGNRKIDGDITASVLIMDKVGNEIYRSSGGSFSFNEEAGVYVSSFKPTNDQKRQLGSGGYHVMLDISFGDKGDNRVQRTLLFGVQE